MMGQTETLQEVTYENLMAQIGAEVFNQYWQQSHLISINNWTMLVPMTDLWRSILQNHCDAQVLQRQHILFLILLIRKSGRAMT